MTRPVVSKFLAFFLFMLQAGPAQSTQDRPAVASERAPRLSPMADSEVHFDTVSEEKAWAQVTDSTHVRRVLLAKKFLDSHPTSPAAGQAHYMIATDSYRQQRFDEFIVHAEAALNLIAVTRLHQKVRRLQLQAQLAFYYAESGRPEQGSLHGRGLLESLTAGPTPPNLSESQWAELRRRLEGAAYYAIGRSQLGQAAVPGSEVQKAGLAAAVANLEKALERSPMDTYAAIRLGDALRIQGRLDDAARAFGQGALSGGPAASVARRILEGLEAPAFRDNPEIDAFLQQQLERLESRLQESPRSVFAFPDGVPHPIFWWDDVPDGTRNSSRNPPFSNALRRDYVGADECRSCHPSNYRAWSQHPHRWMNALATEETVKGDFSKGQAIEFMGGKAEFRRSGREFQMRLRRGSTKRTYVIRRTLGSRFFQYYIGQQTEGPESRDHPVWSEDHVLPFGYWIDEGEWVPVVHIDQELPDSLRDDPFASASSVHYDRSCSACHTTWPVGDWMLRSDGRLRLAGFSPREVSLEMSSYLAGQHPEILDPSRSRSTVATTELDDLLLQMDYLRATEKTVNLGISCEACHNGGRAHVESSTRDMAEKLPLFFPAGEHLFVKGEDVDSTWGRTSQNLNWTCARCHSGGRPRFAGGMDTWNSTEYSDAVRGACYDPVRAEMASMEQLTCVRCHNPHYATGSSWTKSPDEDDEKCLECHSGLRASPELQAHTHHRVGTPGSRCMNCHMPRINEGLQDVVRTHQIFSPTEARMIEANQPNACNLCHLDKPIGWTLRYLSEWYGRTYSAESLSNYSGRDVPVGLGWLESSHQPTRLVAAAALTRSRSGWALPQLSETLDDPFLINRQFAQRGLERMLGIDLGEKFGYRFYMTDQEREVVLERIRRELPALVPADQMKRQ